MLRHLKDKVIGAVKTMGSYDPDEIMFLFEESLTGAEAKDIYGFLKWISTNDLKFGTGNIDVMFSAYKAGKEPIQLW